VLSWRSPAGGGASPGARARALTYSYTYLLTGAAAGASGRWSRRLARNGRAGEFVAVSPGARPRGQHSRRYYCGVPAGPPAVGAPNFHGGEVDGRLTVAGLDAIEVGTLGALAAAGRYVRRTPETQFVSTTCLRLESKLPLEMRGTRRARHRRTCRSRVRGLDCGAALLLAIRTLLVRRWWGCGGALVLYILVFLFCVSRCKRGCRFFYTPRVCFRLALCFNLCGALVCRPAVCALR